MNSTANFGLNQWEHSDRIQMVDFNNDNLKIDASLLAGQAASSALSQRADSLEQRATALEQKTPYVKLREITTSASSTQVDLDLSDITFANYQAVHLDLALRGTDGYDVYVRINGSSNAGDYLGLNGNSFYFYDTGIAAIHLKGDVAYQYTFPRLSLTPRRDGNNYITSCTWVGMVPQYGYSPTVTFSNLTTLNLVASSGSTIFSNSRITIWGEV